MKYLSIIIYLFFLVSCSPKMYKNNTTLHQDYANWKMVTEQIIDAEDKKLRSCEGPYANIRTNRCKSQIQHIDLKKNKERLDSLRKNIPFNVKKDKMILIDDYAQGFEYHHGTEYLLWNKKTNKLKGVVCVWYDPNPSMVDFRNMGSYHTIERKSTYLKQYLELESDCKSDYVYIITILDSNYQIEFCKVVLSPEYPL